MKFVDFFAGIGGIRLGLEQAGHECVGFCEFDKYARTSYKAMYNTEREWESHDVRTTKSYDVPNADIWCFGFPCQDISVAGKQKGLQEGERSGLFYEIMRLLAGRKKEDRPRWLLVENVKNLLSIGNGFDFARLLLEVGGHGYSIQWCTLNSKDLGVPQNRERVFLVGYLGNISGREVFPLKGTDGENPCELMQIGKASSESRDNPNQYRVYDKNGISPTLNAAQGGGREPHIVEQSELHAVKIVKPFSTSGKDMSITDDESGVASCVYARDYKGISRHGMTAVVTSTPVRFRYPERGVGSRAKCQIEPIEVANALTAKHCGDQTADCSSGVVCMSIREQKLQKQIDVIPTVDTNCRNNLTRKQTCCAVLTPDRTEKRQNGRRIKEPGEPSFTLTAQDRHGVAIFDDQGRKNKQLKPMDICPTLRAQSHGNEPKVCSLAYAEQNNNISKDGTVGTLTCDGSSPKHNNRIIEFGSNVRIRRLTPRECWRLQGFPDEYFDKAKAAGVSDTQLYKQAGNGVTVNVARAIGERLREIELTEDQEN